MLMSLNVLMYYIIMNFFPAELRPLLYNRAILFLFLSCFLAHSLTFTMSISWIID